MARSTPGTRTPRSGNTAARQHDRPDYSTSACDRAAVQRAQQRANALSCAMACDATPAAEV